CATSPTAATSLPAWPSRLSSTPIPPARSSPRNSPGFPPPALSGGNSPDFLECGGSTPLSPPKLASAPTSLISNRRSLPSARCSPLTVRRLLLAPFTERARSTTLTCPFVRVTVPKARRAHPVRGKGRAHLTQLNEGYDPSFSLIRADSGRIHERKVVMSAK